MKDLKYVPIVTYILIGINVLVFFVESASGGSQDTENILRLGGAYTPYIIQDSEWYRLFNSMFLHFGFEHIFSNMISLFCLGQYVEQYFGKIKYIVIYILSGLLGNVLSMLVETYTGNYSVSVGASGAVCGVLGAMVIFAMDSRTKGTFPMYRMIIAILLVVGSGFSEKNIDNMAHIGGLISGFLTAYTFYYFQKKNGSEVYVIDGDDAEEQDFYVF